MNVEIDKNDLYKVLEELQLSLEALNDLTAEADCCEDVDDLRGEVLNAAYVIHSHLTSSLRMLGDAV